jgi:hypothetical protein
MATLSISGALQPFYGLEEKRVIWLPDKFVLGLTWPMSAGKEQVIALRVSPKRRLLVWRTKHVLAEVGDSLIKRRGFYCIRSRRGSRVYRVSLFRLAQELGLLRIAKGAGRTA